jgi:hypothetical protein
MPEATDKCPTCGEQLEMTVPCYLNVTMKPKGENDDFATIVAVEPDNSGCGDRWIGALCFEHEQASLYCPTGCEQPDWTIDLGGLAHWEQSPS